MLGVALPFVLLITCVLFLLGEAVATMSIGHSTMARGESNRIRAHEAAMAGLAYAQSVVYAMSAANYAPASPNTWWSWTQPTLSNPPLFPVTVMLDGHSGYSLSLSLNGNPVMASGVVPPFAQNTMDVASDGFVSDDYGNHSLDCELDERITSGPPVSFELGANNFIQSGGMGIWATANPTNTNVLWLNLPTVTGASLQVTAGHRAVVPSAASLVGAQAQTLTPLPNPITPNIFIPFAPPPISPPAAWDGINSIDLTNPAPAAFPVDLRVRDITVNAGNITIPSGVSFRTLHVSAGATATMDIAHPSVGNAVQVDGGGTLLLGPGQYLTVSVTGVAAGSRLELVGTGQPSGMYWTVPPDYFIFGDGTAASHLTLDSTGGPAVLKAAYINGVPGIDPNTTASLFLNMPAASISWTAPAGKYVYLGVDVAPNPSNIQGEFSINGTSALSGAFNVNGALNSMATLYVPRADINFTAGTSLMSTLTANSITTSGSGSLQTNLIGYFSALTAGAQNTNIWPFYIESVHRAP